MQLYIRLRNAIFAETGFCLAAPALSKKDHAFFRKLDAAGHATLLEPIAGCDGSSEKTVCITLTDYPAPDLALIALVTACQNVGAALDGDTQARKTLAACWESLLFAGCGFKAQSGAMQVEMLQNIFGQQRVSAAQDRGNLSFLGDPDWPAMLDEALSGAA